MEAEVKHGATCFTIRPFSTARLKVGKVGITPDPKRVLPTTPLWVIPTHPQWVLPKLPTQSFVFNDKTARTEDQISYLPIYLLSFLRPTPLPEKMIFEI